MEISGTSSQQAGIALTQALPSQASSAAKDEEAKQAEKNSDAQKVTLNEASVENRPVAGGTVGSVINTSA